MSTISPYKGLEPYSDSAEDRSRFFGREDDRRILIAKIFSGRVTLFFGVTGSGKSSLLRAGVKTELTEQDIDVAYHFKWNPREDPRISLKTSIKDALFALERISSPDPPGWKDLALKDFLVRYSVFASIPFVIIVDQFEEFFLYHASSPFFDDFIQELSDVINDRDLSVAFLFSMREDFLAELDVFRDKAPSFSDNRYRLKKLTLEQAREAIVRPAEEAGRKYEPKLVEQLLQDLSGQYAVGSKQYPASSDRPPASSVEAPYLQIVCRELWEDAHNNDQNTLTLARYKELGRTRDIVRGHVEQVMNKLALREQALAFEMFQYLVTRRGTKMAYRDEDLADALGVRVETLRATLEDLARPDVRILRLDKRSDEMWYELYHDMFAEIIQGWRRQFQDNEDRRIYSQISTATRKWIKEGKDESLLLRGVRLIQGRKWEREHPKILSPPEEEFLEASSNYERGDIHTQISEAAQKWLNEERDETLLLQRWRLADADDWAKKHPDALSSDEKIFLNQSLRRHYRWVWIKRSIIGVITSFAVIAAAFGFYASVQREEAENARDEAEKQAKIARSRQLAAQAHTLLNDRLDLALLLSVGAFQTVDTVEARSALLTSLQQKPHLLTFLHGHEKGVRSIAFNSDGTRLISIDEEQTVILWDITTSPPKGVFLTRHPEDVKSVVFSPDSTRVALVRDEHSVIVWDIRTNQPEEMFRAACFKLTEISFWEFVEEIPEDIRDSLKKLQEREFCLQDDFLGAIQDQIGEKQTAEYQDVILEHASLSQKAVIFRSDDTLLTLSEGNIVRLWNILTGELDSKFPIDHPEDVKSVVFSPDSKRVAMVGMNQSVLVWNIGTNPPEEMFRAACFKLTESSFLELEENEIPKHVLDSLQKNLQEQEFCSQDAFLKAVQDQIGEEQLVEYQDVILEHAFLSQKVTIFSSNETLLTLSEGNIVRLWDVTTRKLDSEFSIGHAEDLLSVAVSPDGTLLVSGSQDGVIRLWNVATGELVMEIFTDQTGDIESVAFSPNGTLLVSRSGDNTIRLWDIDTGEPIGKPLTGYQEGEVRFAFSSEGVLLASGSWENKILLWNIATNRPEAKTLTGQTEDVVSVAFSQDGTQLVSGSLDHTIRRWNVTTGEQIKKESFKIQCFKLTEFSFPELEENEIPENVRNSLQDLQDQEFCSQDDFLRAVQDQIGKEQIATHKEHILESARKNLRSIVFSPDGTQVASIGEDQTVILWDITTHPPKGVPLIEHTEGVMSVAFSPDGTRLASGSWETIYLWDVELGKPIGKPLTGHTADVVSVAFSPDGTRLASGSLDKTIRLWDVNPKLWQEQACIMANRNLDSQEEWQRYFPEESYRKICPKN